MMNFVTKIKNYPFALKLKTLLLYKWRMRRCGHKTIIERPLLFSPAYIEVGSNVYIRKNCRIEGVSSYMDIKYNPVILIEDGVTIQQNLHLTCAECIEIGENTAVAANVTITDIIHPYEDIHQPAARQPLKVLPVKIGKDCNISNNAVILPGSVIGKHCVVGANSVVNGIFEDYCVIVGIPARVIKRYNYMTRKWEDVKC